MAARMIASHIEVLDPTGEPIVDSSRPVSGFAANASREINLGAFRGLAFALIFETVLVLLGAIAWQLFRILR